MNLISLTKRVRAHTRDFTDTVFRTSDIEAFLNEGIQRAKQLVPELRGMQVLMQRQQEITHLPDMFQDLLALYGAARCFAQDERHYQAGNLMNEFEFKMVDLKHAVQLGEVEIVDEKGMPVYGPYKPEYIGGRESRKARLLDDDVDLGVDGL